MRRTLARKAAAAFSLAALTVLAAACGKTLQQAMPLEPESGTACALDGMVLKDFPGPKAQVHYAEGEPDFYCDLKELFAQVLLPEQKRAVSAIYVQDMGKTAWEHPEGHWIDARKAVYVIGSKKPGSMGPGFGSFSSMQDAEAFTKKEGGRIVRFEQVTAGMIDLRADSHDSAVH